MHTKSQTATRDYIESALQDINAAVMTPDLDRDFVMRLVDQRINLIARLVTDLRSERAKWENKYWALKQKHSA